MTLNTLAVNTATAELLGASVVVREVPYSLDQARRQAVDSAAADLIARILQGWKKRQYVTQIHAENADYTRVQRLKSGILAKVRGAASVIQRDLTGTTALLEVIAETPAREVLDAVGALGIEACFQIDSLDGNRIDIRFAEVSKEEKEGGK